MKKISGEPGKPRKVVTKIDDYAKAVQLMEKMEAHLPIPAYPTPELAQTLRDREPRISAKQPLYIKRVHYLGDEGGISCNVTPGPGEKEVFIVSLTHLRIDPSHPLFRDVVDYQRERVQRIARSR